MRSKQKGMTLVEIAIVLVIIGILLGGILKAQALINSARARELADSTTAVQAAYYGFFDRYRRVPGDWNAAAATIAIGVPIAGGGVGPTGDNGRLDTAPAIYGETNGLWEQLSKAGFLKGQFLGTPGVEPTTSNNLAPLNAFNKPMTIGRTPDYEGTNPVRLGLVIGRGVPVNIMRELDEKLDDGKPSTGALRATAVTGALTVFAGANNWGGREAACVDATPDWDIARDAQDCNAVYLF